MVATVTLIYSGATAPDSITESGAFRNADFLFFVPNGLGNDEGYEVAGAIRISIVGTDSIGGLPVTTAYGVKEMPLPIDFLDTAQVVRIPVETSQTRLEMTCCLATSYSIGVQIYAVSSGVTLQDLSDKIDFANNLLVALSARQLRGSAAELGDFLSALARLATGDVLAIADILVAILPASVESLPLPGGNPDIIDVFDTVAILV